MVNALKPARLEKVCKLKTKWKLRRLTGKGEIPIFARVHKERMFLALHLPLCNPALDGLSRGGTAVWDLEAASSGEDLEPFFGGERQWGILGSCSTPSEDHRLTCPVLLGGLLSAQSWRVVGKGWFGNVLQDKSSASSSSQLIAWRRSERNQPLQTVRFQVRFHAFPFQFGHYIRNLL